MGRQPASKHAALWAAYRAGRGTAARNALALAYLPAVEYQAQRVAGRLAAGGVRAVRVEELVSAGVDGLFDAIARYNPARGTSFITFCTPRIHGAIMDSLRAADHASRRTREYAKAIAAATARLAQANGRPPYAHEVAAALGISPRRYGRWARTVAAVQQERDVLPLAMLPAPQAAVPGGAGVAVAARRALPARVWPVVYCYYWLGLPLKAIGLVLGLSESRVCQLHAKALAWLRRRLVA